MDAKDIIENSKETANWTENEPRNRIVGIVVHNLTNQTTTLDLMKMFQEIGEIDSIDMNVDATGFPLGSANIIFKDRNDAAKAHKELNAARLDGQCLMLTILRENCNKLHKTEEVNNCYSHSVDMYFMSRSQNNHSKDNNECELDVDALCKQIPCRRQLKNFKINTKIIENSKIVTANWIANERGRPSSSINSSSSGKKVEDEKEDNKIVGILAQNLTIRMTRLDLVKVFQAIGEIHSIDMHVDATGFPLGSANIKFEDPENAVKAHKELNETILDGQNMKLLILREKRESSFYSKMNNTGKVKKCYMHNVGMDFMNRFQKKNFKVKKEWDVDDLLVNGSLSVTS